MSLDINLADASQHQPAKGQAPLETPDVLGATLLARQRQKAMKKRVTNYPCRRTVRITKTEDEKLREFAAKVGIPVSEYMRRLFFGGRPIIAKTDDLECSPKIDPLSMRPTPL